MKRRKVKEETTGYILKCTVRAYNTAAFRYFYLRMR
jgi:hypothetical protein